MLNFLLHFHFHFLFQSIHRLDPKSIYLSIYLSDQRRDCNDANDDSGRKDDGGDQTDDVQPEIADVVSTGKEPTRRYGQKHDGSNNGKPAPRERKATENAKNLGGEKRSAPAKAAGAKSIVKRKR